MLKLQPLDLKRLEISEATSSNLLDWKHTQKTGMTSHRRVMYDKYATRKRDIKDIDANAEEN